MIVGLITFGPIIPLLLLTPMMNAFGCTANEGTVIPCVIWGGIDIGQLLHEVSVLPWLLLVTIPTGIMCFITLSILIILDTIKKKKLQNPRTS